MSDVTATEETTAWGRLNEITSLALWYGLPSVLGAALMLAGVVLGPLGVLPGLVLLVLPHLSVRT